MAYNRRTNQGYEVPGQPGTKRRSIRPNRPFTRPGVPPAIQNPHQNIFSGPTVPMRPGPNAPMRPGPGQVPNQMTPGPNAPMNPGLGNPPQGGVMRGSKRRRLPQSARIENRGGSRLMRRPGMGNIMRNRGRRA